MQARARSEAMGGVWVASVERGACGDVGAMCGGEGASGRFGTWKSETPLVPNRPVSTNTRSWRKATSSAIDDVCLGPPLARLRAALLSLLARGEYATIMIMMMMRRIQYAVPACHGT